MTMQTEPRGGFNFGWNSGEHGWVAYVEDEEKLTAYKAGGWSAGVAI